MRLCKLSRELRDAYRGSGVARRVQHFDGWLDRAALEPGGAGGYDHTETVKDYLRPLQRVHGVGLGPVPALRAPHAS